MIFNNRKNKQDSNSSCAIVQSVIEQQRNTMATGEQKLKNMFNQASTLIQGMECLKKAPGSTFNYKVEKSVSIEGKPSLKIETNLTYPSRLRGCGEPHTIIKITEDGYCKGTFDDGDCKVPLSQPQKMIETMTKTAIKQGKLNVTM